MFDVSPLVPQARPIALAVAQIYYRHTRPWLVGLLVHGSALKGGFIPGCSDIDFQLYVKEDMLDEYGALPHRITAAIQRELATVDIAPFQYIQAYTPLNMMDRETRAQVGPIPGAYHLIYGQLPIPEASTEEALRGARHTLEQVAHDIAGRTEDLLGHGGGRLERVVRLLCTDVWPALYSLLVLRSGQPLAIWKLPKEAAIAMLSEDEPTGEAIRQFYQCVSVHYSGEQSVESALAVMQQGITFLRAVDQWYKNTSGVMKGR